MKAMLVILVSFLCCSQLNAITPDEVAICTKEGLHSDKTSKERAKLTFANMTQKPVYIKWVKPNASRLNFANLEKGQRVSVDSFIGHAWIVEGEAGNCLGGTVISQANSVFEIK